MPNKVFLIHGWGGSPDEGWRPWLKTRLEKHHFIVSVPSMPDTNHPRQSTWLKHLTKIIGQPDPNCYFVGHSLGCITILRYLESLPSGLTIGGAVLVAGFTSDLGIEEVHSFFTKPINWPKIKNHCSKFIAVHSDNDQYVSLHYSKIFQSKLNAQIIIKHHHHHFSGDDGINQLPVVLKSILQLSSSK